MEKKDLKSGMLIEMANGDRGLILLGTRRGDICAGNGAKTKESPQTWFELEYLNDDLTYRGLTDRVDFVYEANANITAASFSIHDRKLIWSRSETEDNGK